MTTNTEMLIGAVLGFTITVTSIYIMNPIAMLQLIETLLP